MAEILTNVKKQVDVVFSIANTLRGTYQPEKYRDVIIPMTIIRRLECALKATKDDVCSAFEEDKDTPDAILRSKSGYLFYNTSRYTLGNLLADIPNLEKNLKTYIDAFSSNIKRILTDLQFDNQIKKMKKGACLTGIIRKFSELDLSPEHVSNHVMGYIFEEIIRRFSENTEAGDHYTPREIVRLLTKLALAEGSDDLKMPGKVITVADVACGTGGMLSSAQEALGELVPDSDVYLYGQEILEESYAICLADMLIKGQRADNIRNADTMKEDCFPDVTFRIELVNPPFGQPWGGKDAKDGVENAVNAEHNKYKSRFPAGLPAKSDMQMLFMQHIVHKLDPMHGRACVISNGSPLFSGGTSSGESQIRRYLLENDLIEAIIGLPTDLFYNTNIAIYVWIISKNKRAERKGKVQLINATGIWSPMRRSLGNKRKELTPEQIEEICDIYTSFKESELCRIFDNEEFLYKEYAVYQPLQRNYCIAEPRIASMCKGKFMENMHNPAKLEELQNIDAADRTNKQETQLKKLLENEPKFEKMIRVLREHVSDEQTYDELAFKKQLKQLLVSYEIVLADNELDKAVDFLSEMDKSAPLRTDRQGHTVLDSTTKDTEIVKLSLDVDSYMEEEVYPYVPDAKYVDEEDDEHVKTGAEIPFNRYFYKYDAPESSAALLDKFNALEAQLQEQLKGMIQG